MKYYIVVLENKTKRGVVENFALFEQMTPGDHFQGDSYYLTVYVHFLKDYTTS